jgi:2-amino-4-hydroxy-6-hydroxymethyldihydropteridine diphosphokinase
MQSPQGLAGPDPTTVYLGLGSNLGDRARFIDGAVARLVEGQVLRDVRLSALYETDAVAVDPQPAYLNAVVRGDTYLPPEALLARCLEIELDLGRLRPAGRPKAPRTIDIDVLLYGALILHTPTLTVPHPALLDRAFVLVPLRDVAAPGLAHPENGRSLTVDTAASSAASDSYHPPRLYRPPATR